MRGQSIESVNSLGVGPAVIWAIGTGVAAVAGTVGAWFKFRGEIEDRRVADIQRDIVAIQAQQAHAEQAQAEQARAEEDEGGVPPWVWAAGAGVGIALLVNRG